LPATALVVRVLRREEPEVGVPLERLPEFGDVHLTTMIQTSIQTLEDRLRCEVHLVEQNPLSALHRAQERGIPPGEVTGLGAVDRNVSTEEVHEIRLVGQVDSREWPTTDLSESRNEG